jgi:nucleotide-binding universal stress UspA family protein
MNINTGSEILNMEGIMKEINKVLFPVDLSEVSPKVSPWALTIAKRFNAEIHLLFVARRLEYLSSIYVTQVSIENFEGELVTGAEKGIEEFAQTYFKEYPAYKTKVVLGDAAEEILSYINSERIDLVIIGTHGRKGLERIFFGSVAERVIKQSPVPVLSVNPYGAPMA